MKKTFFKQTYENIREQLQNRAISLVVVSFLIIFLEYIYIALRFSYLNEGIPFWFTKIWGDMQLAPKSNIYVIPLISVLISLFGLFLILFNRYHIRYLPQTVWFFVISANLFLFYSVVRIIFSSSSPFPPLIPPQYMRLLPVFFAAYLFVNFILPYFIEFAHKQRLITNPDIHGHPAMVLKTPSARGGGFVYGIAVVILSILFVGVNEQFSGFYLSIFMLSILGLLDDYQNTHPDSEFKFIENPLVRLILMVISILPLLLSGVFIQTIQNPITQGLLNLQNIPFLSVIFTVVWLIWFMNLLSWSNGVDGQYSGIVGFTSIIVAILALRFEEITPLYRQVALIAAISAGASFGFTKHTWHPSKIMWGFGATVAGLVIAILSIFAQTKIVTSVLIIIIPFMDAFITVIRRLFQGKNPLKGDRGHLHHHLLDRGWSVHKVSLFYWLTTLVFGLVALLSPEKYFFQVLLIIFGLVAFFIILLNVISFNGKKERS